MSEPAHTPPNGSSRPKPLDDEQREALARLYRAYRDPLVRFACRNLIALCRRPASEEEGENVVHDLLAHEIERGRLPRDDLRNPLGFLRVVIRRWLIRSVRRSVSRRRRLAQAPAHLQTRGCEPLAANPDYVEPDQRGYAEILDRALAALRRRSSGYGEVISAYLEPRTSKPDADELARRLDIPRRNVPVRKHRARHRFRQLLLEEAARAGLDDEQCAQLRRTTKLRVRAPRLRAPDEGAPAARGGPVSWTVVRGRAGSAPP